MAEESLFDAVTIATRQSTAAKSCVNIYIHSDKLLMRNARTPAQKYKYKNGEEAYTETERGGGKEIEQIVKLTTRIKQ